MLYPWYVLELPCASNTGLLTFGFLEDGIKLRLMVKQVDVIGSCTIEFCPGVTTYDATGEPRITREDCGNVFLHALCLYFLPRRREDGIYNLGGVSTSFLASRSTTDRRISDGILVPTVFILKMIIFTRSSSNAATSTQKEDSPELSEANVVWQIVNAVKGGMLFLGLFTS